MKKRFFHLRKILFPLMFWFPVAAFAQGIEIGSGASVTVTGDASIEINNGSFVNNGTYTKGTETVSLTGSTAATVSGSNTVFNNLVISNSGGITVEQNELTTTNLTVNTGAKLTVATGKALTVTGNLDNSGTFTIESDATGNGSLMVDGTASNTITYNRYLTGGAWHLVSPPVSGQNIADFVTDVNNAIATNGAKYGLAPYNNTIPDWNHFTTESGGNNVASAGNFGSGTGYEILRTADGTVTFSGNLQTDNVSLGVSKNSNAWNLVGNPFTASLKANSNADATNNFITVNELAMNSAYQAIYVWDAASSTYLTINHASNAFFVAPGQAFFINSVDGGGTIRFNESMQSHQTGNIFKSGETAVPQIELFAETDGKNASTHLYFMDGTTAGLDPGYDAGRFTGGDNSFAVFTRLAGDESNPVDFDIQCLPAGNYNHIIPVGLNCPEGKMVTFRLNTNNMPLDIPVILEDREKGIYTELRNENYSVILQSPNGGAGRFFLHTGTEATASQNELFGARVQVIPLPEKNKILISAGLNEKAEISIFDLTGRKLITRQTAPGETNYIEAAELRSGCYIVAIRSGNWQDSRKISWIK